MDAAAEAGAAAIRRLRVSYGMQTVDQVVQMNYTIPYFTGVPEDVIVNTWHAVYTGGGTPTNTNYAAFANRLTTFYQNVYANANTLRGSWVNVGGATVKAYDLWRPEPRQPAYTAATPITGTTASAGNAPTELAICLSYKATYVGGFPPSRQRGRIYLGGFATALAAGSVSSFPEVSSAGRTNLANQAATLRTGLLSDNWTWVVLSPTNVGLGLQETFEVTGGWIDNAADTQRRRGQKATARTTW